jgi:hypothetical protein
VQFMRLTRNFIQETQNAFGNTVSFDNIFDSMEIVLIIAGGMSNFYADELPSLMCY